MNENEPGNLYWDRLYTDFQLALVDGDDRGPAAQWAAWTGMAVPGDGQCVFPGCLATLVVENGICTRVEPNVWVLHRLS